MHVPGCSALYPARKFVKGETICIGAGGWERVEPGRHEGKFTLRVTLRDVDARGLRYSFRRPPEER